MDLTDIYRAFHPKEARYTFFSNVHGTFSRIDHMTGHKTSLNKFKKIEIISSIFSDHKGLKLQTNPKGKKKPKHLKSWRLNGMLLNNEWVKNEIRYFSLTAWPISLNIMLSSSIHAVMKGRVSFFLSAA